MTKFDLNRSYDGMMFYISSLRLMIEALDEYISYLSGFRSEGNKTLERKYQHAQKLVTHLRTLTKGKTDWEVEFVSLHGESIVLIKSTLPWLIQDSLNKQTALRRKQAPPEAHEELKAKIERLNELLNTGVLAEAPQNKLREIQKTQTVEVEGQLILDDEIRDTTRELSSGQENNNDRAINDAATVLEHRIRAAAQLPTSDFGKRLVDKAFRPTDGILQFSTNANEQTGYWHLYDGVLGTYKNSTSHRRIRNLSKERAQQIVQFIDHLVVQLEDAKKRDS